MEPSVEPSAEPSAEPTVDPYPIETELVFESSLEMTGTTASDFNSDTAAQNAVIETYADTLENTTSDDVTITNVTDTTRRRLYSLRSESERSDSFPDLLTSFFQMGNPSHENGKQDLSTGIEITVEVKLILEKLGFTTSDGAAVYETLKDQLTTAVSDGDLGSTLTTKLSSSGSAITLTVDTASLTVSNATVVVAKTPSPTAPPTAPPTVEPTGDVGSSSDSSDSYGCLELWALIVIVVGGCICLGVAGYFALKSVSTNKVGSSGDGTSLVP
eukprot:CAMPEP_0174972472 /NCGR_PEP_ID=MMETSP0004_2-20121128/10650_1 /TAXON_ID=420556 /ORGANISM="Ochromonas sp., Strain CCMP1393" /LENGTH=271 /DNA_ID=CAMNT_0016222703 /DNA_START=268 /DNA_END=1083 /DNA_ORIENTATION=+